MAKTNLAQLKNWFKNGLKPPQEHFWNWLDSFWHKDEKIPIGTIEDLEDILAGKADADHTHTGYAATDASNLDEDDVLSWKAKLYDNDEGELTDADISLTDAYPDLAIPAESTQKDFNDVLAAEVAALKEPGGGELTLDDANVVTSKNYADLGVDQDEPLTEMFDEIITRLVSLGSAIQTGIKTPVGLSCAGNPNYPASEEGDSYKVTAPGRIGGSSGIAVEIGDMIVCTADSPGGTQATAGANFFVLQTNVDQATESIPGFAKIATDAQAAAGTDDTTIVTPKKLGLVLSGLSAQNEANSALTQNYSFYGLTPADKQKDYNEALAAEAITEVTIIPLTAWDEAIEATTDYSGLSYVPYPMRILSIKAVSETAPVRQSIKISVSKNDTFIGTTNAFLEIPTTGRISTGTHDIVGTDLITGDRLRFFCNQTGDSGSTGVQIILITKKISLML